MTFEVFNTNSTQTNSRNV